MPAKAKAAPAVKATTTKAAAAPKKATASKTATKEKSAPKTAEKEEKPVKAAATKPAKPTKAKPNAKAAVKSTEKPNAKAGKKTEKSEAEKPAEDAADDSPKKDAKKDVADSKPVANGLPTRKRKADDAETESDREPPVEAPKPKKTRTETAPKPKKAPTHVDIGKKINDAPTQVLDVYVFGEGSSGELGLGSMKVNGKKPIDVKRPRLNDNLSSKTVGVVQIACGGMHAAALTRDNKILTWGVNDQGALGRDTTWDGGLRDMDKEDDSDSDSDDEDSGLNPKESTPTAVSDEAFVPGTKFVQVVASDSATFTLTEDGRVYGWGTFRSSDGILGFTESIKVRSTPMLIPSLKGIKALAAGANHILALDVKGNVVAWGCGQQNQLGRRIIERNKMSSLIPQGLGLPRGKIAKIACGAYHSFALDKNGVVWGWGLNNYGEIGFPDNAGEDGAVILKPVKISLLEDHKITDIDGGVHHSVACSDKGELFTWGRIDGYQIGFEFGDVEKMDKDDIIYDERGQLRILVKPTKHEAPTDVVAVTASSDNSFAITKDGKAYSWGFSANYQTGQGTIDDIHKPTHIDNTAVRDKKVISAGAGGQFSVLIALPAEAPETNGVNGTA